jgi:hypothetical protein
MSIAEIEAALEDARNRDRGRIKDWSPAKGHGKQRFWLTLSNRETPFLVAAQARKRIENAEHPYQFTIAREDVKAWWRVRNQRKHTVAHGYLFVPVPADGDVTRIGFDAPVVFVAFKRLIRPGALPYSWVTPANCKHRAAYLVTSNTNSGRWELQIPAAGIVGGQQRRVSLTKRYGGVAALSMSH